jgi:hypothetical protein
MLLSDVEDMAQKRKDWLGVQEARGLSGDCTPTRPLIGFVTSGSAAAASGGVSSGVAFVRAEAVHALTHKAFCPFPSRPAGVAFYALARSVGSLHYRPVVVRAMGGGVTFSA